MADSFRMYCDVIFIIENNYKYLNLIPKGEPQFGRRGLYRALSSKDISPDEASVFWVMNMSDGHNTLLDIADTNPKEMAWKEIITQATPHLYERIDLLRSYRQKDKEAAA